MPKKSAKTAVRPAKRASARSPASSAKKRQTKATAPRAKRNANPVKPQRPIELYFWPTYNGIKISIMLEECGLPFELKVVNINRGDQFDPHFLSIAPNNRMPAIVDPDGPDGKPISIFESGAILQYLGRKTGKFYPKDERGRVAVDQWLFWQCAGFGPMAGQAHHFRGGDAPDSPYATERYTNEMNRLYGVMNKRLQGRDFLAGDYSIADMACFGVVRNHKRQGQTLDDFTDVKAWFERMNARPGVERGAQTGAYLRSPNNQTSNDPAAMKILYGQRARA